MNKGVSIRLLGCLLILVAMLLGGANQAQVEAVDCPEKDGVLSIYGRLTHVTHNGVMKTVVLGVILLRR